MASDSGSSSSEEPEDVDLSDVAYSHSSDKTSQDVDADSDTRGSPRSCTPSDEEEPPAPLVMTARAYQLEMLEESLKQNVIVAMDTGSGKTQVAILRIQKELERSEKIAWFLAPTVSLAEQQFAAIRAQIPGVQSRSICGDDNVDAWSTKPGVWDAVLQNIRIVVSTYQILFDAVSHAFVPLSSLGLIVIDEAHNCVKKSSVARLMHEHYAPNKARGLPVPHILGLTASPLMTSNLDDLEVLEQTLHAVCKTPSKHRDELMAQVNRPEMKTIRYGQVASPEGASQPTPTMERLKKVYLELDLRRDPYILHLATNRTPRNLEKIRKAFTAKKTYCQTQMASFCRRTWDMYDHIGPWAADYYIYKVTSAFLGGSHASGQSASELADQERKYLAEAFAKVDARPPPRTPTALSPKVQALLNTLESHQGNTVGIVFVKERATVTVLSHILAVHPKTASRYRVGSMVGTSRLPGLRQDLLDLSQKEYLLALQAFRKGTTNLLVATSVLEEGIDVPVCNLVICFDSPDNLKSFIQRRGRARMSVSQMYLFVEDDSDKQSHAWQNLEREMKRKYEDDMRENQRLESMEGSGEVEYPVLRDNESGAQLTMHDAKQHLEHFCATLSTRKFVDWSPFYVIHDLEGNPIDAHQPAPRKARVHLPVSLAPELRSCESLYAWNSEANACKDAAFQAYAKLYDAGLVNRNLLPIRESDLVKDIEQRAGLFAVGEQLNPWPLVAQAWKDGAATFRRRIAVTSHDNSARAEFELALPVPVPTMEPLRLHWDHNSSWLITMDPDTDMAETDVQVGSQADHTPVLFSMAFGHRWPVREKQYPVRFVSLERNLSLHDMGTTEINPELLDAFGSTHLIRDVTNQNHPHFYVDWLPAKPPADLVRKPYQGFDEAPEDMTFVAVKDWPKKAGAFRPPHPNAVPIPSSKPYPRVLPASQLRLDSVPAIYARVGLLIPAITHSLEVHLVAKDLLESRLGPTGITDLSLVVMAISTSAARGPTDYERIEFLGDSILKFCTTVNCSAKYLKYPEGCLSPLKDKIVSNSRLFRAAREFGLDRYIIHKLYTLNKWRPTYVEDLLDNPPPTTQTRKLSTKILADVVEALIAASYLSGGIPKALACMSLFLPEFEWRSIEEGRAILYNEAPADEPLLATMGRLEELVGYTFTKKALLVEALTHPSCNGPGIRASLDRLEFLGDAVLDYIVVNKLFSHRPQLDNATLHLLRTALVNADVLAFLVMEWTIVQDRFDVNVDVGSSSSSEDGDGESTRTSRDPKIDLVKSEAHLSLISFLRHGSQDLAAIQRTTALRHTALRPTLSRLLQHSPSYPWSTLTRLQAPKVYSDVFESVLGAVWVDSGGGNAVGTSNNDGDDNGEALAACEAVLERAGVLPLLRRILRDGVHLLHPKEELGRLAVSRTVEYRVEMQQGGGGVGDGDGDGGLESGSGTGSGSGLPLGRGQVKGEKTFACEVFVGGERVEGSRVEGALSREEARTRAAEGACRALRGEVGDGKGGA